MSKNKFKRGTYEKKTTIRCVWCDQATEVVHESATTCSGKCRGRLFRFRQRTGLEPEPAPGNVSVEHAIAELVAELLARERQRRMSDKYLSTLPAWKRPPGS